MRIRYSLRTLLLIGVVIATAPYLLWWIPKSNVFVEIEGYREVGYYRGLGFSEESGYFGKNWYQMAIDAKTKGYESHCVVDVDEFGHAPFRSYYKSGTLREEGVCVVHREGDSLVSGYMTPVNAKYFAPDGKLISEIKNGTGKLVYCYDNGSTYWEQGLVDGRLVYRKIWSADGELESSNSLASDGTLRNDLAKGERVNNQDP